MDIRVALQRISIEEDPDCFVAFLKEWFENQYPGQRLRLSIDFGEQFSVAVNGLENSEDSWIVGAIYERAAFEFRRRQGRVKICSSAESSKSLDDSQA